MLNIQLSFFVGFLYVSIIARGFMGIFSPSTYVKEVRKIFTDPTTINILERIVIAAVIGGVIGWERDLRNKQAGIKTHLLVSVGSALIMILSDYGFVENNEHINARFDPGRLAHGVISGIGFLGAGAIIRHSDKRISGITTAATLWVVAAIGLSIGAGFYLPAFAVTIIILINAFVLRSIEAKFISRSKQFTIQITMEDKSTIIKEFQTVLKKKKGTIKEISFVSGNKHELELIKVIVNVKLKKRQQILSILDQLKKISGVHDVSCDDLNLKISNILKRNFESGAKDNSDGPM